MNTKFKPDFGLFAMQRAPNAVQTFYSLYIDHIARVGTHLYSLNFNYLYDGVEYAVTLDFDSSLLPTFMSLLARYISRADLDKINDALTAENFSPGSINFDTPISDIGCECTYGEIQHNANESYVPLVVKRFF